MISGKISKHVHYKFFPWNASTASLIASRNVSFDCPGASGICVFNCIHKSPGQVWISMFKFREMLNHTSRNNPYRNSLGSYHRWQNRLRNFSERRRAFLSFVFRSPSLQFIFLLCPSSDNVNKPILAHLTGKQVGSRLFHIQELL